MTIRPISDEDLFEMRETVHHQFVRGADTDVIAQTVDLISTVQRLIKEVEKWTGRAGKAKYVIEQAKRIDDIHKGIKEISGKVGEAKEIVELAENIGKTPGGMDDIGAMEGALGAMDFVISKLQVPGFKQLWDSYIYKAAKLCLSQLRGRKEQLYKGDRQEGVRLFFEQHRNARAAPDIKDAYFHGIDPAQHFPGGQPMLTFMWGLMRNPDSITSVPAVVEDFFVEWRKSMNAGAGEQLESDDSIGNLWNAFSRERAPNIVGWLRRNRNDAWVKLYGGMPPPN